MLPTKIVVHNKRYKYHTLTAKSWNVLTEYVGKDVPPQSVIPDWLLAHWKADRSALGYARFSGLTPEQALYIVGLTKTGAATLCIDRWSRVAGYKLKVPARPIPKPTVPATPAVASKELMNNELDDIIHELVNNHNLDAIMERLAVEADRQEQYAAESDDPGLAAAWETDAKNIRKLIPLIVSNMREIE